MKSKYHEYLERDLVKAEKQVKWLKEQLATTPECTSSADGKHDIRDYITEWEVIGNSSTATHRPVGAYCFYCYEQRDPTNG